MTISQKAVFVVLHVFLVGGFFAVYYGDQNDVRACMIGAVTCACLFGYLKHRERVASNRTRK